MAMKRHLEINQSLTRRGKNPSIVGCGFRRMENIGMKSGSWPHLRSFVPQLYSGLAGNSSPWTFTLYDIETWHLQIHQYSCHPNIHRVTHGSSKWNILDTSSGRWFRIRHQRVSILVYESRTFILILSPCIQARL